MHIRGCRIGGTYQKALRFDPRFLCNLFIHPMERVPLVICSLLMRGMPSRVPRYVTNLRLVLIFVLVLKH